MGNHATQGELDTNKHAILLAGALAAVGCAFPAAPADEAAKTSMRQADDTYGAAKKQAKADYKARK